VIKTFLSLFLIFSLCTPTLAQERKTAADIEPMTGISFPRVLGSLKRMGMKKYTPPELGISYRYASQPLPIADIFIYDKNQKYLGTGLNQAVRTHFEEVKNEIFLMEKSGYYRAVKKVSEGETVLANNVPKLPALTAVFTYSQPPGKGVAYTGVRTSHIFLTAYKGQLLKIQFTYPKNQENRGKEALRQFLADFGKALNNNKRQPQKANTARR
jgi:hypothetical protein